MTNDVKSVHPFLRAASVCPVLRNSKERSLFISCDSTEMLSDVIDSPSEKQERRRTLEIETVALWRVLVNDSRDFHRRRKTRPSRDRE